MSAGPVAFLRHLIQTRIDRDGQAQALEEDARLFSPPEDGDAAGRRDRGFGVPREILERSLSQKVLDGWLQNQHQILVPLTFRLGRLPADDVALVVRFAAAALLNAARPDDTARSKGERWLHEVGADEGALVAFRAALEAPLPLSTLTAAVLDRGLEAYAYAAAVVMADTRDAAGHLFANYVAARLALPADAIRSIDRRYRR